MRKIKYSSVIHVLVLAVFVLFNNCSGFSPQEIAALQSSSGVTPNPTPTSGSGPTPTPTPTATPTPTPAQTPTPNAAMKRVFFGSGHLGRTVISCDDGKTWINDRSDNPNGKCNVANDPNYIECTHNSFSAVGLDAGDGYLFANYGWGYPGVIRKSRDGLNWQVMKSGSTGGGIAYANGQLWSLWDGWYLSSDFGQTWANASGAPTAIHDDHPMGYRLGTKFIAVSRTNGITISRDLGLTWEVPAGFQSYWANAGLAESANRIVTIGYTFDNVTRYFTLYSATSTDQGKTWTSKLVDPKSANSDWEVVIYNGKEFLAWSHMAVWKSTDGLNWTSTPLSFAPAVNQYQSFGKIAFDSTTGTYVMISYSGYSQQIAAKSGDGVNWTVLDSAHFKSGHPINGLISTEIEAKYCP